MKWTSRSGRFTGYTLNKDTEDLGTLASSRPVIHAYCTSSKCTGNFHARVYKQVPRNTDKCPDCGYFLVYKKADGRSK